MLDPLLMSLLLFTAVALATGVAAHLYNECPTCGGQFFTSDHNPYTRWCPECGRVEHMTAEGEWVGEDEDD